MPARVFDNSDDEGSAPVVQALTEFTSTTISPEVESAPLVIERIANTFRNSNKYVPNALTTRHARGDGKSIAELEAAERSRNNVYGLNKRVVQQQAATEETAPVTSSNLRAESKPEPSVRTDEERAIQELLDPSEEKSHVIIDRISGNKLFSKNETHPETSTLADYEAVPVEAFGLAMLRGMGYDPALESQKEKPKEKTRRPDFLGLGATERPADSKNAEELAKKRFQKRKEERVYVPVVKVNKRTGEIIHDESNPRTPNVQVVKDSTFHDTTHHRSKGESDSTRTDPDKIGSRSSRSHKSSTRQYDDDRHNRRDRDGRNDRDDRSRYRSRSPRRDSSTGRHRSSKYDDERRYRTSEGERERSHRYREDDARRSAR